jgi:hypothetical protein
MKPMNSNKFFLLIAASMLTGVFVAATALAVPSSPEEKYQTLSAVDDLNPSQSPQLRGGFTSLGGDERRYRESLPLQLSGPMKKAKSVKYTKVKGSKSHRPSVKKFKKVKSKNFNRS